MRQRLLILGLFSLILVGHGQAQHPEQYTLLSGNVNSASAPLMRGGEYTLAANVGEPVFGESNTGDLSINPGIPPTSLSFSVYLPLMRR